MQSETSSLIHRGFVDNRQRDRVTAEIHFLGSAAPLSLDLTGNCLRDLAGCLLEFEADPAPVSRRINSPTGRQTGQAGELTASRRLLLPGPFSTEMNCLYLEWFLPDGQRQALMKPQVRCRVSAPEWRMTDIEELEQKRRRWAFIRKGGPARDPGWFALSGILGLAPPSLGEAEWEELVQEAEEEVDRLIHLFDQGDLDPEWAGHLSRALGWAQSDPATSRSRSRRRKDDLLPPQGDLNRLAAEASGVLRTLSLHFPADTRADAGCRGLVSRLAQVSAILETARESVTHLEDGDQPLLVALVKRSLAGVHGALEQLASLPTNQWLGPEDRRRLSDQLFGLRETALHTMSGLRR